MKTVSNPLGIFAKIIPFFGLYIKCVAGIPVLGKLTALTNKALGRLIPRLSFLGFRKESSYENAVWNWEVFLRYIGGEYTVDDTDPESRLYIFKKCPAGYCGPEHLAACRITLELDNSLVDSSGARLIVEKRLPTDNDCRERIVKK